MIEEKLVERGVDRKRVIRFAESGHFEKEKKLMMIVYSDSWDAIFADGDRFFSDDGRFLFHLTEVLSEIGLERFEQYSIDAEKNKGLIGYLGRSNYELHVAKQIAEMMLKTLRAEESSFFDRTLTLDRLYDDTFNVPNSRAIVVD
jgi:hypothetical protein